MSDERFQAHRDRRPGGGPRPRRGPRPGSQHQGGQHPGGPRPGGPRPGGPRPGGPRPGGPRPGGPRPGGPRPDGPPPGGGPRTPPYGHRHPGGPPPGGQHPDAQVQIRTFIAIVPPQRLLVEVRKLQQRLAKGSQDRIVRWLEPAQIHLTLRFLGNVRQEQVPELRQAVEQAVDGIGAFRLSLERLGCFPHTRAPRIIWVGVGHNWEVLRRLHERLTCFTEEFGEPPETREFQPHVTIARVKAPSPRLARPAGVIVESAGIVQLGEWLVNRVDIVQSRVSPKRSVYTTLGTVRLSGMPGLAE